MDLLKNYDFDYLFDKWFEEYESSDNFEDYVWYNQDEEVEEYKEENPEMTDEELKKWENDQLRKNAREWFDSHQKQWKIEIENKCHIENNKVKVYRALTVNIEEFLDLLKKDQYQKGFNGLGIFWAWDKNKADAHWGSFSDGETEILISGEVDFSFIDLDTSMILNFSPTLGLEEAEFQLLEGYDIYISTIEDKKENKLYEINKVLKI